MSEFLKLTTTNLKSSRVRKDEIIAYYKYSHHETTCIVLRTAKEVIYVSETVEEIDKMFEEDFKCP